MSELKQEQMAIVTRIEVDPGDKKLRWNSRLVYGEDKVMLEVVSMTFSKTNKSAIKDNLERVTNRMLKEIASRKDASAIFTLLVKPNA